MVGLWHSYPCLDFALSPLRLHRAFDANAANRRKAIRWESVEETLGLTQIGLWHSYPCPCPRRFEEQMCRTNGYSRKFVYVGGPGHGYEYHSSMSFPGVLYTNCCQGTAVGTCLEVRKVSAFHTSKETCNIPWRRIPQVDKCGLPFPWDWTRGRGDVVISWTNITLTITNNRHIVCVCRAKCTRLATTICFTSIMCCTNLPCAHLLREQVRSFT